MPGFTEIWDLAHGQVSLIKLIPFSAVSQDSLSDCDGTLPVLGPEPIKHEFLLFCHLNDSQLVKDEPKEKEYRVVTIGYECHCNA